MTFFDFRRIATWKAFALFALLNTGALLPPIHGATGTWSNVNGGSWDDIANWGSSVIADGAGFSAYFSNANLVDATRTVTLDSSRTIGSFYFGDSNTTSRQSYHFNAADGATLTFDNGPLNASLIQISLSGGDTLNLPIKLNSSLDLLNNANDRTLTLTGAISAGTAGLKTITIGGISPQSLGTNPAASNLTTGTVFLNGPISNGDGQVAIHVNSASGSTVYLNGNNSFTGGVTLTKGILFINDVNSLGSSGPLTINGGMISSSAGARLQPANGTPMILNGDFSYSGTQTLDIANSATVTLNKDITISVLSQQFSIYGAITDGVNDFKITKTGTTTLYLSNNGSNYSGGTVVESGKLVIRNLASIGTGNVLVKNGASFTMVTDPVNQTLLNRVDTSSQGIFGGWGGSSSANLDFSNHANLLLGSASGAFTYTGTLTPYNNTFRLGGANDTSVIVNSALTGSGRSLEAGVKGANYGSVTLGGTNTYDGSTTLWGPVILQLNGNTGSIADSSNLNIRGNATFRYDNTGATTAISESLANLNFLTGDGTILSQRSNNFDTTLTFTNVNRSAGATGNITTGGTNNTTALNKVTLTNAPTPGTFLNQGLFVNGDNYAAYDASGYLRALAYGSDTNASAIAGGATMASANGKHVNLNGAISAQTTESIQSLRIASNFDLTLANGAALTVSAGGILKSGANASTISGGAGITTGGATELVIRTNASGDTLTINSSILASSTGGLTKSGAGVLVLGGNNAYSGATTINSGTLRATHTNALSNSDITMHGGTLDLRNTGANSNNHNGTPEAINFGNHVFIEGNATIAVNNIAGNTLHLNKTIQLGDLTIGGNTLTITNNNGYGLEFTGTTTLSPGVMGNTTFNIANTRPSNLIQALTLSGKVTGSTQLTQTGNGTLQLTNHTNDFVGNIIVTGGVLAASSDGALGAASNQIILRDATSSSTFRAIDSFATSRTIVLGNNLSVRSFIQVVNGKTLTLNSAFAGQNGFVKSDNGTLLIHADNSGWDGDIFIHDGILQVSHNHALGSINGFTQVNNQESALHLSNNVTIQDHLILFNTGINTTGALNSVSGNNTVTGPITLNGDASIGVESDSTLHISSVTPIGINSTVVALPTNNDQFDLTLTGSGTGYMNSVIATENSMLIKLGTGTWHLTATNTFTRDVIVNQGTLILSGAEGGVGAGATWRISPGATLILDNTNGHLDNRLGQRLVQIAGNLTIIGDASAPTIETITGSNLRFGNAASVVTLDADPTQSITLQVNSGTIERSAQGTALFRGDNLGNTPGAGVATIKSTTAPTFVGQSGAANTINRGILSWALVDQSTTGLGQGFATYDTTNGIRLLNANEQVNYLHGTANVSIVQTKGSLAPYTTNSLNLGNGGGIEIQPLTVLTIESGGLLATTGNVGISGGIVQTSSNRELIVHALADVEVASVIANTTGGLTKTGAGTLTLGTANYYTGATTISQGTLKLDGGHHTLLAGQILNVNHGGTLDLNGNHQTVGQLRSLTSTAGEAAQTGGTITTTGGPATFVVSQTSSGTYAGTMTGALNLIRSNGNQLILTNEIAHTGSTLINGGITSVRNNGRITLTSGINLQHGTLQLSNAYLGFHPDRIADDIDITMNGGTLSLYGRGGAMVTETVGNVTLTSGLNVITASAGSNNGNLVPQSSTLTITSLQRNAANGATVNFGQSYVGTSSERLGILASSSGSSENIIIQGGLPTVNNIIGPWAITTVYFNTNTIEFTGYDQAGGVGALNAAGFAGYDASTLPTSNQPNQNIRITANNTVAAGGLTINTLNIVSNSTVNSPVVSFTNATDILNLAAGGIAVSQDAAITALPKIGNEVNQGRITAGGASPTGPVDLFIYYQNSNSANALTINSAIIDNPNGGGQPLRLILSGTVFGRYPIQLASTQNAYTGGTVINGANVQLTGNLGTGGITINGGNLTQNAGAIIAAQNVTLNGPSTLTLVGDNTLNHIAINNTGTGLATDSEGTAASSTLTLNVGSGVLTMAGNLSVTSYNVANTAAVTGGTLALGASTRTFDVGQIAYEGVVLAPDQASLNISSVISGTGVGIIKTGEGLLQLSANNTFNGGIDLQKGGLVISHNSALGLGTLTIGINTTITADGSNRSVSNAITINGDFTMGVRGPTVAAALTLSGPVAWGSSAIHKVTVNSNPTTVQTISGPITGSGGIVKEGIGTLALTGNNSSTLDWRSAGAITVNDGTLRINSDNALGTAPTSATAGNIVLNNGALSVSANVTLNAHRGIALGAQNGSATGVVEVVNANDTLTYAGAITDNGTGSDSLLKTGAGKLFLNGTNTYTGNTTIGAGTLALGANGSIGNSKRITVVAGTIFDVSAVSGGYQLRSNQTLEGAGTVTGPTVALAGSVIAPGTDVNHHAEKLTFANGLTLNSGSVVELQLTSATYLSTDGFGGHSIGSANYLTYLTTNGTGQKEHDLLNVTGTLTQQTGAQIRVVADEFIPVYGQIFNLIDWSVAFAASTNLGPAGEFYRDGSTDNLYDLDLPDISNYNLLWDTSRFVSHGILAVVPEPSRALLMLVAMASMLSPRRRKIAR
jgi:autotransporter-associated beta strand protein